MNIITHGLIGWGLGQRFAIEKREAAVYCIVSLIPDIDALGVVFDLIKGGEAELFSAWHHKFGHNIFFGLFISVFAALVCSKKLRAGLLALIFFHLHLFCDLIGARGPDGDQWPIYYWFSYSEKGYTWSGQWEINAWPNIAITVFFIGLILKQTANYGYSPFVFISKHLENLFVNTIKKRFGKLD